MSDQLVVSPIRRKKPLSGIEKRRNAALERAESINPVTRDFECAAPLLRLGGVTTVAEYCSMSAECKKQAERLEKVPNLLVADPSNSNEFIMVRIGRREPVSPKSITGMYWIDVRGGIPILVPENTLVYWR